MAAKIKCPGCGAKNDASLGRCRICTAMLQPGGKATAPEPEPVAATDASFDMQALDRTMAPTKGLRGSAGSSRLAALAGGAAAAGTGGTPSEAGAPAGPVSTAAAAGGYSAPPGTFGPSPAPVDAGISFDVPSRHADVPPPVYDAPEAESWDAVPGISFDVAPRHGAESPPPVFEDPGASWASGGGISFDVAPRHGGEAPPPVVEPNVSFDPNALEIEEPPL